MQYRFRIPVCGAILINDSLDKCVLVKGWSSRSGWGFPKGKINQDEEYSCCAIREVLEETGYDITPLLKKNDYVEFTVREQRIRLYLVVGVPEDTEFNPQTRKEISEILWFNMDDLPTFKTESRTGNGSHGYAKLGSNRFYMVAPFMDKLRSFVNNRRKASRRSVDKPQQKPDVKPEHERETAPEPSASSSSSMPIPPSLEHPSDALKSLLGVMNNPAKSTPIVQTAPANPNPSSVDNILQQLFATQQPPSGYPAPAHVPAHRASFVEQMLKNHATNSLAAQPQVPAEESSRRNSLLNALQGGTAPSNEAQSLQTLLQGTSNQ
ncbi:mRNA-decapping enzyme subunit 2 [Apophysomyces ossiformis]|uniref:mRNA-decapping enzyme subunit 2 n=1 Tax=Apophysomyces ossiformis TaxID=679940 RepID=A0A8H7BMU2_9FUNG|nr:mRNA-decapping enzyme subunit 2 [Apophysomyces ossiformis]